MGNPTTYRGKTLKWGHLRNLEKFNVATDASGNETAQVLYTYNSSGIRTSKTTSNSTTKFVLSGNKILSQNTNGTNIYFQYGVDGLIGFNYDNLKQYYYKKNAQGDIIGIYDENYTEIVKYVYDAWGNHICRILTSFGTFEQIDSTKEYTTTEQNYILIANTNPFRYRGYYYDTETGLYYLNSRYYDPELGRFINSDDISVLELTQNILNGLNLYSYCNNNPVNEIDESGKFVFSLFSIIITAIVAGAVVGAASVLVGDVVNFFETGNWEWSSWQQYLGNALGGAVGGVISIWNPSLGVAIGSGLGTLISGILEMYVGNNSNNITWGNLLKDTAFSANAPTIRSKNFC